MRSGFLIASMAAFFLFQGANAAEINVLASGATKEACLELISSFERLSGHKVVPNWTGTVDIKKRLAAGELYDVVIVGAPEIDALIAQGKLVPGSRVDVMKSGVGVAIRAGAPKPDISSSEALKKTLLAAQSIGYSTGPSGVYVASMFERLGIADQIKPKLKQVPTGGRIGTLIETGEVEIGFQQISELIHETGIAYIGPLPPELQNITLFSAGIHRGAREPLAAKALIEYLTAPEAAPAIRRRGMEPA